MAENYNIACIGAGRVASHLLPALQQAGQNIVTVVSRSISSARRLADITGSGCSDDISSIDPGLDILFLTVPDHALPGIFNQINWFRGIVVHTSGSYSIDDPEVLNLQHGCFYPLQSFTINRSLNFNTIPVFVEGSDETVANVLINLARLITGRVYRLNSDNRAILHLAAVFANNFTNHMLTISEEILERSGLGRDVMHDLIRETFERFIEGSPAASQTGPAVRGDHPTIEKHLKLLSFSGEFKELYQFLTDSIQGYYKERPAEKP